MPFRGLFDGTEADRRNNGLRVLVPLSQIEALYLNVNRQAMAWHDLVSMSLEFTIRYSRVSADIRRPLLTQASTSYARRFRNSLWRNLR